MPLLRSAWVAPLLVALVAFAAQVPGLDGPLLWDDAQFLGRESPYVTPARWLEAVRTPFASASFYWRPLATSTLLLDALVWDGAAWGYRVTGALLHAVTSGLACVLLARLLTSRPAAVIAALAFALHPVHVETATWASTRFDLCAGLFALAALACVPAGARAPSKARTAALAGTTLLACLSKENGFVVPAMVFVWAAALRAGRARGAGDADGGGGGLDAAGGRLRAPLALAGASALGVGVALFLRWEVLGWLFQTRPASVEEAGSLLEHLLLVGRAVAKYVHVLLAPWGAVGPAHHAPRPVPVGDALAWAGVAAGLAMVVAAAVGARRGARAGWLLAGVLVALGPVSQILPLDLAGDIVVADRYAYLAAFFVVAAVAVVVLRATEAAPARRRVAAWVAVAVVVSFAVWRTWILPRWTGVVRFWEWAVAMAPDSYVTRSNLAYALADAGRTDDALREARRLGPEHGYVIGWLLRELGQVDEASEALDGAIRFRPRIPEWVLERADIRLMQGRAADALADYERVLELLREGVPTFRRLAPAANAGAAEALAELPGRAYAAAQRADAAEPTIGAHEPNAWLHLARARITLRQDDAARRALVRAEAAGARPGEVQRLRDLLPSLEGHGGGGR